MKISKKLNEQMLHFCRELIQNPSDQTGAAVRAHYSEKTAASQASRLLKNVQVQTELRRLRKQLEEKAIVTVNEILLELRKVGFCDIAGAFDADGSLKPIHEIPEEVRRAIGSVEVVEMAGAAQIGGAEGVRHIPMYTKKVKFLEKTKALETLGRHLKMFTDRVVVDNFDELAAKMAESRKRAA